jgi:hypothetical protein
MFLYVLNLYLRSFKVRIPSLASFSDVLPHYPSKVRERKGEGGRWLGGGQGMEWGGQAVQGGGSEDDDNNDCGSVLCYLCKPLLRHLLLWV